LARAWAAGVAHVVVIGESAAALETGLALAERDPRVSVTAGVHPHDAAGWGPDTGAWLAERLADPRVVGTGEMGLDYHYDHSPREVQRDVFDRQLALACAAGKPAVIHARSADPDVEAILRNHPSVTAILHSFSSGAGLLRAALAAGHYVSFSGMVTFRNWRDDDLVRMVPDDRLLLETDAPYLAPVPHRGKRNEPAFVRETAFRVAQIRGVAAEALIAETGANARRVFGGRLATGH
ncbi:MAG TPA: TatD family hydrolase, partial [Gemmatimonadales bacterium]|nr:TatD family hydrolase [Gemmatimonadales bacterium]